MSTERDENAGSPRLTWRYYVVLCTVAMLSIGPPVVFLTYNKMKRDPGFAWYAIKYAEPQILVWGLFAVAIVYGLLHRRMK